MKTSFNDIKILSVLVSGDKYGLEIIEEVGQSGTTLLLGSLYNGLRRLEKNGLVKSYWGEKTSKRGGNRRRYYKITAKGKTVIQSAQESLLNLWNWKLA